MELKLRIYLLDSKGNKFMGLGVLSLLTNIEKEGSLLGASKAMHLSYTKAYRMLEKIESVLGCTLVERKKGGSSRDGSFLTPFAKEFIEKYKAFCECVNANVKPEYEKFELEVEKLIDKEKIK